MQVGVFPSACRYGCIGACSGLAPVRFENLVHLKMVISVDSEGFNRPVRLPIGDGTGRYTQVIRHFLLFLDL